MLRDIERTALTAIFLKRELSCNEVLTVVPFEQEGEQPIPLIPLSDLAGALQNLLNDYERQTT